MRLGLGEERLTLYIFFLTEGKVDVECEVCLGKCSDVVRWWVGESDALRIFCLTTFLETALSQVSTYFLTVHMSSTILLCTF